MKKYSLLLLFFLLVLSGCDDSSYNDLPSQVNYQQEQKAPNYVTIKYREDKVDISNFESFDTTQSAIVKWIRYDRHNQYMIIDLSSVKYHYCLFPWKAWDILKQSINLYEDYQLYIRWNYDCRKWGMPSYESKWESVFISPAEQREKELNLKIEELAKSMKNHKPIPDDYQYEEEQYDQQQEQYEYDEAQYDEEPFYER